MREQIALQDVAMQAERLGLQITDWVGIQANNLIIGFNQTIEAGKHLQAEALDQFLTFAMQHPTVALMTQFVSEMTLPNLNPAGAEIDWKDVGIVAFGAALGGVTGYSLGNTIKKSDNPAQEQARHDANGERVLLTGIWGAIGTAVGLAYTTVK